jgi:alpha-tubulin suppressor-like RCC1 family protein
VAVAGGLQFKMIGAGSAVTCGVTTANEAYCWGDNLWGTVGDSSTVDRWVPTRVSGGHVFTSVVVGGSRACALDQNGAVYCWGSNHTGELGVVTADPAVTTPIPVASGFSFDSLVTGTLHTCGWDQAGDVRCWGHNGLGELGDGSTEQRLSPVLIAGGRFATLSCGYRHACGIGVDGYAYCWGSNQYGRLGTGTDTSPILTPALVLGQQ